MTLRPEDCKPGVQIECIAVDIWGELVLRAVYTVQELAPTCWCVRHAVVLNERRSGSICGGYALKYFRLLPGSALDVFREALQPLDEVKPRETEKV